MGRSRASTPSPGRAPPGALGVTLEHHPALDGLRGLAVGAVVVYHGGFAWMRGGYLGVSAFFTLSGFLIARLLLAEHGAHGRISLRRFWARRARRLLPAAMAALAGIVIFGATVASPEQVATLRGDLLAAMGYGANWRFIVAETSYADLGAAPSPVQHFWSLAVEEQFYLLFPLVMVGLLRLGRGRAAPVFGALAAIAVVSVAATAWLAGDVAGAGPGTGSDRAYFGSDTRAAELLIGALLAVVLARTGLRHRPRHQAMSRPRTAACSGAAFGALALLAVAWSRLPSTSATLYRGGLALHALAIALVIYAALRPGPVRTVLAAAPLRALGRISYGVYVYHWPIFLWLTTQRTGLGTGALFALRAVVTLAVASLSYALIEQPVRERWALFGPALGERARTARARLLMAPAGVVVVAGVILVASVAVTADPPRPTIDFDAARSSLASPLLPPVSRTPVVASFGDSTALMSSWALQQWSARGSELEVIDGSTLLGCGLPGGGPRRHGAIVEEPTLECESRIQGWPALAKRRAVDIAVVQFGPWDIIEHQFPGEERWRSPGDPRFDRWLRTEITAASEALRAGGATVVWLTAVPFGAASWLERDGVDHRGGAARFNQVLLDVARQQMGIRVVDLAAFIASRPDGIEDRELRPDGVHFTKESAATVGNWLGPAVLDAARAPAGTVIDP